METPTYPEYVFTKEVKEYHIDFVIKTIHMHRQIHIIRRVGIVEAASLSRINLDTTHFSTLHDIMVKYING